MLIKRAMIALCASFAIVEGKCFSCFTYCCGGSSANKFKQPQLQPITNVFQEVKNILNDPNNLALLFNPITGQDTLKGIVNQFICFDSEKAMKGQTPFICPFDYSNGVETPIAYFQRLCTTTHKDQFMIIAQQIAPFDRSYSVVKIVSESALQPVDINGNHVASLAESTRSTMGFIQDQEAIKNYLFAHLHSHYSVGTFVSISKNSNPDLNQPSFFEAAQDWEGEGDIDYLQYPSSFQTEVLDKLSSKRNHILRVRISNGFGDLKNVAIRINSDCTFSCIDTNGNPCPLASCCDLKLEIQCFLNVSMKYIYVCNSGEFQPKDPLKAIKENNPDNPFVVESFDKNKFAKFSIPDNKDKVLLFRILGRAAWDHIATFLVKIDSNGNPECIDAKGNKVNAYWESQRSIYAA